MGLADSCDIELNATHSISTTSHAKDVRLISVPVTNASDDLDIHAGIS